MPPKIKVLPENLANKIAAGEVIERPAAVIKELIENALDAKAQSIEIMLVEGGTRLIQIRDDGEGMCREDAQIAFERHATSKISDEADLWKITTFGFRGEALPSIASVSNIRLVTCTRDHDEGCEMILEAGTLKDVRAIGAPAGSLLEVRDLFYNVPARKKFLKSPATELSHIRQTVMHQALAHPQVQFGLTHHDRTLLRVPVGTSRRDRFSALYGEEVLLGCIEAHSIFPDLTVHLFVSKVPLQKGIPRDQILFVNGRCVKSPLVTRAVYDAYGTLMMKGDQPFYLLYLDMDPVQMDVNVHPTKREIRFCNTDGIYQSVRKSIREALVGTDVSDRANGSSAAVASVDDPTARESTTPKTRDGTTGAVGQGWRDQDARTPVSQGRHTFESRASAPVIPLDRQRGPSASSLFPEPLIRSMGQIYGTFLLAEVNGELVMVDQHTAHERILYEKFRTCDQSQANIPIQPLLIPRQVALTSTQAARITEHLALLHDAGFSLEPFGETLFLIRSVPVMLSAMDLESFLIDLSEDLAESAGEKIQQPRLNIWASMACHGAVRAHQALNPQQIETLLRDYFVQNTPPTCPHGRPILIKYSLTELEKLFRRL